MNHKYHLGFDLTRRQLVRVAETASNCGKVSRACRRQLSKSIQKPLYHLSPMVSVIALAVGTVSSAVLANPTEGQVVAGQASLNQTGSILTVNQASDQVIINWSSFNIAAGEQVTFAQPSASSVALNRVLGNNPSAIFGRLDSNGHVFLVNPNGIYFAPGAQVSVGGLVASTLDISDADFLNRSYRFVGDSSAAVRNDGRISTAEGGYVALVGNMVSNQGGIVTPGGSTALGAGSSVRLTLAENRFLSFEVDGGAYQALVENGGMIEADGGFVILSAEARNAIFNTVVNNSGVIRAQTVASHDGSIVLIGGASGTVEVSGTLDASAPNGGNGGFIETSGQHLKVADGTTITTKAATGASGTWLIDPVDFTIASGSGALTTSGIGADTLQTSLGSGNVTITTDASTSGNGDIIVNAPVAWSANTLTLSAHRNIDINAAMTATNTAALSLQYGQGAVAAGNGATYNVNAPVNLASTGSFSTKLGSDGVTANYTIITSLGAEGSTTGADLQGMNGGLASNYVLGANINASGTSSWNSGAGFVPIGNSATKFTGTFDGLGHTITGLTINRPSTDYIGLFGFINLATIRNVGMVGGSFTGNTRVGSLVGKAVGSTVSNSYAAKSASNFTVDGYQYVGGLIGLTEGSSTISNSYTDQLTVSSSTRTSGDLNGYVGGLVGYVWNSTISNSHSNASSVVGDIISGGLVGYAESSSITLSYATGNVSGTSTRTNEGNTGGLVGYAYRSTISNSYATGAVSGSSWVGGLYGASFDTTVSESYATGDVTATGNYVGGLAGESFNRTISKSFATGSVSGLNYVGGLVGYLSSTIENSYATGNVAATDRVGGFAGYLDNDNISNSYSTGIVSGATKVGGFIGDTRGSTVNNSYFDRTVNPLISGISSGSVAGSGVTGKTTAELRQASTFSGWDLSTTGGSTALWRIYEGNTTPLLRNFLTVYSIADVTSQYSGSAQTGTTASGTNILGSAATGTAVGTYTGYYSNQQGYDISGNTLTITAAPLTITGSTTSSTYTGSSQTNSFTTSGLLGSDAVSSVSGQGSGTTVGTYADSLSGATGTGLGNYTISYVNGGLTITVINSGGILVGMMNAMQPLSVIETPIEMESKASTASSFGSTAGASNASSASSLEESPDQPENGRNVSNDSLVFAGSRAMRILDIVEQGVNEGTEADGSSSQPEPKLQN